MPDILSPDAPQPVVIGVVADTHVPDRQGQLNPRLLPALEKAGVSLILHAGDVSAARVLDELAEVAPVKAVRGNRDWTIPGLPLALSLSIAGVSLGLTHGHGGWARYLIGKAQYVAQGYSLDFYWRPLRRLFPTEQVIVFGHTHHLVNQVIDGCLLFNPGAAYACHENDHRAHAGVLTIFPGGRVEATLIDLDDSASQGQG